MVGVGGGVEIQVEMTTYWEICGGGGDGIQGGSRDIVVGDREVGMAVGSWAAGLRRGALVWISFFYLCFHNYCSKLLKLDCFVLVFLISLPIPQ